MQDSKRDTDVKNRLLDSVGEGEGGMIWENSIETVYYHKRNRSPAQVWGMRQSAQGWCTGTTLRDGMGREAVGDSGWETHVHPWLTQVNVWQILLQYCKVMSLQFKKKKIYNVI